MVEKSCEDQAKTPLLENPKQVVLQKENIVIITNNNEGT